MAADIAAAAASFLSWFLARVLAAIAFFYMLSMTFPSDKAGFVARLLASWLALAFCAFYGMCASIVLGLAGRRGLAQWATARSFKFAMAAATGVTFDVSDPGGHLDTVRPAVFIGNHQTAMDVLMLGCMFPKWCSVTAKTSLRHYPLLGWYMSLSGTVFIDRANSRDARQAMSGAADAIRSRRQSVYMFPEGTRSNAQEPMLLDFKKGAFHLAVQAGVPIVPVVVANYSHIYSVGKLRFRAGRVPVKVLEPIPTEGLTAEDVPELTRTTRELMLKEHIRLTAQARGQPMGVAARPGENGTAVSTGVDPAGTS